MRRSGPLRRLTPLRAQSAKRGRVAKQRRAFVADLLAAFPICQVPWCSRPSEEVHEPLTRARGGSILDAGNAKAVCRLHHDLIHAEPAWAYETGFLRHSWEESA
jgi:hypothetical protein